MKDDRARVTSHDGLATLARVTRVHALTCPDTRACGLCLDQLLTIAGVRAVTRRGRW